MKVNTTGEVRDDGEGPFYPGDLILCVLMMTEDAEPWAFGVWLCVNDLNAACVRDDTVASG